MSELAGEKRVSPVNLLRDLEMSELVHCQVGELLPADFGVLLLPGFELLDQGVQRRGVIRLRPEDFTAALDPHLFPCASRGAGRTKGDGAASIGALIFAASSALPRQGVKRSRIASICTGWASGYGLL